MKKDQMKGIVLVLTLFFSCVQPAYAMEAPGDGDLGWYYDQEFHHWYYCHEDQTIQTGWMKYHGEWYWFDGDGWMADRGNVTIDGVPYYFFLNGHMAWNQYVGMMFYGEDGRRWEKKDVRVIGRKMPDTEDRDLFSDYMYQVPRSWLARFIREDWEFMFYKQKDYFAAPSTDQGVYYVYHDVDTHYKKVKFTDVNAVLQAFGEYVGYAAGCYRKNNPRMQILWQEQPAVRSLLELPDYYADDAAFYFGKLFATYLGGEDRQELMQASPRACEVLEEILYQEEEKEEGERLRDKARQEREAAAEKAFWLADEKTGPGVKQKEEEKEIEE